MADHGVGGVQAYSGLPRREMRRAAASWIFCALSLYFGYLSYHEASCFDIRDAQLPRVGRRLAVAGFQRPSLAFGFAPQSRAGSNVSIGAEDVRAHSCAQYLGRLLARLTPSQPVGELVVTSQPDKQLILVDAAAGPDNYTARSFVVSWAATPWLSGRAKKRCG